MVNTTHLVLAVMLLFGAFYTPGFAQSTSGTISGTVEDPTKALIPGVTVTATNTGTGVISTTVSNEAGVYNFPSLLPGTYKVTAELAGFQTETYTDVQLGNAQQLRLNFSLKVAGGNTAVEVSVAVDTLLATSSSSVGVVLAEERVRDLPLVTQNAQDLVTLMPGVVMGNRAQINGTIGENSSQASFDSFLAGVNAANVNVQRDGVNNSAGGHYGVNVGFQSATFLNPDMVAEMRVILAPADAELGRGNAQIQVLTRSGTNSYHGSAVWSNQNSALNANTWANNRSVPRVIPDWTNINQYTLSYGGPIKKNKSFFFVLWDGVLVRERQVVNAVVLTPCARNGIFRYFDNWNNGNFNQSTTSGGANPTIAVVDAVGNPLRPATNPDGSPFTGQLRYASVFGQLPSNLPTANADCSNIAALVQPGTNWDPNRKAMDPTGYVSKILGIMPLPNNYENPTPIFTTVVPSDGLNTGGFRWIRHTHGSGDAVQGSPFNGANTSRKQINGRFDHFFNQSNKLGVSYTYELTYSDGTLSTGGNRVYPQSVDGHTYRRPQVMTANFTSTLSPNLVNEVRWGLRRTAGQVVSPFVENPKAAADFRLNINSYPVFPKLGTVNGTTGNPGPGVNMPFGVLPFGDQTNTRDATPLWTYGDTLSWTKGKHAFKFGGELRKGYSKVWDEGFIGSGIFSEPRLIGGDLTTSPISQAAISSANMPGLAGTNATGNNLRMRNLLSFLAGSLSGITQLYYMNAPTKLDAFDDYKTSPQRIRDFRQNEFAFFAKDDWKVRRNLTLNVGLRYEYYGVPWEASGLTAGLVGGGGSLFGLSGNGFNDWFSHTTHGSLTQIQFIGPNSPNPGQLLFPKHWGNVGPAVGFAWQVPWFGEGKTTVRGGYQITYQNIIGLGIADPATSAYSAVYQGDSAHPYLDLTNIQNLVPAFVPTKPMAPILVTDRSQSVTAYDPNYKNPYVENITLAVTRSVRSNLTVDVRYVGTLGRKQPYTLNVDIPDFRYNGLAQAFDTVRAGGESDLLNAIFNGVTVVTAMGPVNGNAGAQLRASTVFNSNLANGNYVGLATSLNTYNGNLTTAPGVQGQVLRQNGFPENFIATNPQFLTANMLTNMSSNNYHSLQAQVTMRQTHGLTGQLTYTWSKNLGFVGYATGPGFTDPVNRRGDYTLVTGDRTHDVRANGAFALPFGPSKLLFGKTSGIIGRVTEGWQVGWVADISSGVPLTLATCATTCPASSTANGVNSLYANGTPDIVGPFDLKSAGVNWGTVPTTTGQVNGSYFDLTKYKVVKDPECAALAANLASLCTLQAVADASTGQILLQNPLPGRRGNLGLYVIRGPLLPRIDGNLSKSIRITESKTLQLRIDAYNVMNHPLAAAPNVNINGTGTTAFGTIPNKTGQRRFQAMLRFNF